MRLVCLPYAGAGIAPFAKLDRMGRPGFEVMAVRLPGREGDLERPPLRTWPEVRDFLTAEVVPALAGEYVIYGHSVGALTGYELCRMAEDRGVPPVALCVAAYPGPPAEGPAVQLGIEDDEQLVAYLTRTGAGAAVRSLPREVLELVLPALRADLGLADSWRGDGNRALRSPVLALHGTVDNTMRAEDMLAWKAWTTGRFETSTVTGDHLFVRDQPAQVLAALNAFVAGVVRS
jgi:surfactin synthase thioesterase subunit